jgi:hypothetical protein
MKRAHFICYDKKPQVDTFPQFKCGTWDISEAEANALVDGMIYYHEAKSSPSYFGGKVLRWKWGHREGGGLGVVFTVESTPEGRNRSWEGRDYSMAYWSGVLE